MASYKDEYRRDASSQDEFVKPKSTTKELSFDEARKERLKLWITFFRRNPHRFIEMYFGIRLYPFQVLMIWMLQRSTLAYIVASRAASKSWIIAVWAAGALARVFALDEV